MAADVLCGVRSYVQTRFLATEDSSTLTIALCVFELKTYLPQNVNIFSQPLAGLADMPSQVIDLIWFVLL